MSDAEVTTLFHRLPTGTSSGSTDDVSSESEETSDEFAQAPGKHVARPSAKAVAGAATTFFKSSSPLPPPITGFVSRWDLPIVDKNPNFEHHYDPNAAAQVLNRAEAPRTDTKLPCDSPPRYGFYKRRLHHTGVRDLKMESATKRDNRVRAQKKLEASRRKEAEAAESTRQWEEEAEVNRQMEALAKKRQEIAKRKKGGKPGQKGGRPSADPEVVAISDDEVEDDESESSEWRSAKDCVVEYICNAAGKGNDGEHTPQSHFNYFRSHQKEMYPERQYGIYKRCKQANETTGGASGDHAEISEASKAAFEVTARYKWIDQVAATAPELNKAAREEASEQRFSEGIKEMVRVASDRNRAAHDRNRVTQDNAHRQPRADTARFLLERDDIDEELKQRARAFIAQDLTF
ncbi:hypothetical protein JCM1840_000192 [Sporobolomyces johnsonii]